MAGRYTRHGTVACVAHDALGLELGAVVRRRQVLALVEHVLGERARVLAGDRDRRHVVQAADAEPVGELDHVRGAADVGGLVGRVVGGHVVERGEVHEVVDGARADVRSRPAFRPRNGSARSPTSGSTSAPPGHLRSFAASRDWSVAPDERVDPDVVALEEPPHQLAAEEPGRPGHQIRRHPIPLRPRNAGSYALSPDPAMGSGVPIGHVYESPGRAVPTRTSPTRQAVAEGVGMAGGVQRGIAHFRDDASRRRFLAAYDAMLATWPRPPVARTVATAFGATHVQEIGGGSGTPMVLLHPFVVSSVAWGSFAAAAAAASHPVYAIDTIVDAGRSTQTAAVRHADDLSQWLDQVLDGLDLARAHLVGASYGAWMALRHAVGGPDRVASVTAMDPPAAIGRPPAGFVLAMACRAGIRAKRKGPDAKLYPMLRQLHNGALPSEPLLELSVASIQGFVARQPFPKRLSDAELRSITAPVLYLVGGATPVVDADRAAARARQLLPRGEADVLAGAGHALPIERAAEVEARALRFVAAVDA